MRTLHAHRRHPHLIIWLLLCMLLASTGVLSAAVNASPADQTVAGDTKADEEAFARLITYLEQETARYGLDIKNNAYHYVILVSSMRTLTPAAVHMRGMVRGVINEYLVNDKDQLSIASYQMRLHPIEQYWQQLVTARLKEAAVGSLPDTPHDEGFIGGHDDHGAVLAALNTVAAEARPGTIVLLFTDMDVSQKPTGRPDIVLAKESPTYAADMASLGFQEIEPFYTYTGTAVTAEGRPGGSYSIYCRVFIPTQPTALAALDRPRMEQPPPDDEDKEIDDVVDDDQPNWPLIIALGLLIVVLGVAGYFLPKRRGSIQIENGDPPFVTVGRRPVYLVADDYAGSDGDEVVRLTHVSSEDIPGARKIAQMSMPLFGDIILIGCGQFRTSPRENRSQVIQKGIVNISIFDHQGDQVCDLTLKRTK